MSTGTHKASSDAEAAAKTKKFLEIASLANRGFALFGAFRTMTKRRREGDKLEQLDALLMLAAAITGLLVTIRQFRKLRDTRSDSDN